MLIFAIVSSFLFCVFYVDIMILSFRVLVFKGFIGSVTMVIEHKNIILNCHHNFEF